MEGGWREDGGRMEGGWREDGGRMEGGWREDGGRMEGGWRMEGGGREKGEGRKEVSERIKRILVRGSNIWLLPTTKELLTRSVR